MIWRAKNVNVKLSFRERKEVGQIQLGFWKSDKWVIRHANNYKESLCPLIMTEWKILKSVFLATWNQALIRRKIYIVIEELTSLFLSDEDPILKKSYLLTRKQNLLVGNIYEKQDHWRISGILKDNTMIQNPIFLLLGKAWWRQKD